MVVAYRIVVWSPQNIAENNRTMKIEPRSVERGSFLSFEWSLFFYEVGQRDAL